MDKFTLKVLARVDLGAAAAAAPKRRLPAPKAALNLTSAAMFSFSLTCVDRVAGAGDRWRWSRRRCGERRRKTGKQPVAGRLATGREAKNQASGSGWRRAGPSGPRVCPNGGACSLPSIGSTLSRKYSRQFKYKAVANTSDSAPRAFVDVQKRTRSVSGRECPVRSDTVTRAAMK